MKPRVTVKEGRDGTADLKAALERLSRERVLVGIPEGTSQRPDENGKTPAVNNAQLMFIHSEGSALRRIPRRRVLQPAIEAPDNWKRIVKSMERVGEAELAGDHALAVEELKRTGQIGSNAAKRWFTDPRNGWPQNSPSTIKKKLRRLKGKASIDAHGILDGVTKFMPKYGTSALDEINTPLVDLDEMRRAIVYVVEE